MSCVHHDPGAAAAKGSPQQGQGQGGGGHGAPHLARPSSVPRPLLSLWAELLGAARIINKGFVLLSARLSLNFVPETLVLGTFGQCHSYLCSLEDTCLQMSSI